MEKKQNNTLLSFIVLCMICANTISPSILPKIPKVDLEKMTAQCKLPINFLKIAILKTIAKIESNGGANKKHSRTPTNSIHGGERAYGVYGLTGLLIRETISKNEALRKNHKKALKLRDYQLHRYMDKHPELEQQIASMYYDDIVRVFGEKPKLIAYSWLNGIYGTIAATKAKRDIKKHWHVKKFMNVFNKINK